MLAFTENGRTPTVVPTQVYFSPSMPLRITDTLKRRHFMEHGWTTFLIQAMNMMLAKSYLQTITLVDASHNVYRDVVSRLANRYESTPILKDGEVGDVDLYELFADHTMVEKYALAYNAAIVSIRVSKSGDVIIEILPPDHADVVMDGDNQIVKLRLARPIVRPSDALNVEFALEEWDISDSKKPVYSKYIDNKWVKQSAYPWKFSTGEAFIPVVVYRATKPPDWWGSNRWPELIEATIEEGIAWTIHRYNRLNASNGIVYALDAEPIGQQSEGSDSDEKFTQSGNGTVLQMKSMSGKAGSVGTLQATFDPIKDADAITASYSSRMQSLGIGDTALERGGAQSGYAIIVRREGLERLRKSTESTFRRADSEYLRKVMACLRIFAGGPVESEAYKVDYAPISVGQSDNSERRAQEKHDLDIGVAKPATILAEREGVSEAEAEKELAKQPIQPSPSAPPPAE